MLAGSAAAQSVLISGTSETGGIFREGEREIWTFSAEAGELIFLRASQSTGGNAFAPRISVLDMEGRLVGAALGAAASSSSSARLDYIAPASGTFTVAVDSGLAGGTGNYWIHFLKLPGEITIPSGETGGELGNEGRHDGAIGAGDLDPWTFSAEPGEIVELRAAQTSGGNAFVPRIRIYDSAGDRVGAGIGAADTGNSVARITFKAERADTFTLLVDSSSVEGSGTYRLFSVKLSGDVATPPGDDGGALVSGNNHDGSTALGDLDVWTFEASAGDRVTFNLSQISGGNSYSPRAKVYDANGGLIAEVSDPEPSNTSQSAASLILPSSGAFRVVIDSALVEGSGSYRLNYLRVPGPFTPGTPSGTPLANGGNHEGSILAGESEQWTFEAGAGETILLRIGQLTGGNGFDPRLRLYDPNDDLIDSAAQGQLTSSSDARLSVMAMVTGIYRVTVDSARENGAGNYRLHFLRLPAEFTIPGGDEGGPLTNGANHEGTIVLGDLDPWTFEAEAGEVVLLRIGQLSGGNAFDPRLRVYDPHGNLIDAAAQNQLTGSSDAGMSLNASVSGAYTVVVDSVRIGGEGNYRLHYLRLPAEFTIPRGDHGGSLINGGNHEGDVTLADLDPWTFEARAGETVLLRIGQSSGGNAFDPRLRLYDPNGELMESAAQGQLTSSSDATMTVTAPISGAYTVVVDSMRTGGNGNYRLHYLRLPAEFMVPGGDEGGSLTSGGNHEGTVTLADLDPWTFQADSGDNILLRIGQLSGGNAFDPRLRVFGPNGALIDSAAQGQLTSASDARLNIQAGQSGLYTVVVDSVRIGGEGNYRLHYVHLPGAFIVPGGDEGGALAKDSSREAAITLADLDIWTIEAHHGNTISLAMEKLTGDNSFRPLLELYGPTGQLLVSHEDASRARVSIQAPDGGIFMVVASSGRVGAAGTYQIIAMEIPEQGKQFRFARLDPDTLTINWPSALAGYVLQRNTELADEGWEDVQTFVLDNGLNVRVTVPIEDGNRFFRLRPPERERPRPGHGRTGDGDRFIRLRPPESN